MSAITWIEGEERSGSVMNGFSSQYRKHMKYGNEALIMTEPTASEPSRPPRDTRCFTGGACSHEIHQLASSCAPTALLEGPAQHDKARPVTSWRGSSTAMGRPCGRLLPILFFALLAVILIPAATAQAACSVVGQPCVRDDFESRAYDLNTGTDDWATDWVETGEADGPTLGVMLVPVTLGELRFQGLSGTPDETGRSIAREVNIPAAATTASLTLRIGYIGSAPTSKNLLIQATAGGIPPLTEFINGNSFPNPATYTFPILEPVSGNNFNVSLTNLSNLDDTDYWYIDFVEVTYDSPLAVTLADFLAEQTGDHVLVTWETASELDNQGFNLYRSTSDGAPETQLNATLIPSQAPGSAAGYLYTWEDQDGLTPGATYYYWLEDVSLSGATTLHGPVSVTLTGPTAVTVTALHAGPIAGNNALPALALALALLLPQLGARAAATRRRA